MAKKEIKRVKITQEQAQEVEQYMTSALDLDGAPWQKALRKLLADLGVNAAMRDGIVEALKGAQDDMRSVSEETTRERIDFAHYSLKNLDRRVARSFKVKGGWAWEIGAWT